VLDRFLDIGAEDFAAAFPGTRAARRLWRRCSHGARSDSPTLLLQFGLDTLYRQLAPDGDGPEYAEFIRLTGATDPYRIFAGSTSTP